MILEGAPPGQSPGRCRKQGWENLAPGLLAACLLLAGCASGRPPGTPLVAGGGAPLLRFDSEVVRLTVQGDSLDVEGVYQMLCSPSSIPWAPLFYPYPRDSLMGEARTLLLACRPAHGAWQAMTYAEIPRRGAQWTVPLQLGDSLTIRTVYRQALRATSAHYIVTTTRGWGEPLRHARFEIRLPEGVNPVSFSFPFQAQGEDGRMVYVYEATDFWPDRDIVVTW